MSESNSTPRGDTAGNNASPPPPAPTTRSLVNAWLAEYYLEYELEDKYQDKIMMQESVNITRLDSPTSWLPDQLTSTALALAMKKWKRSDVLVLSDYSMQQLYLTGMGTQTVPALIATTPIQEHILDDSKRWIVVPCSDGVLQSDAVGRAFNELVPEKPEKVATDKEPTPEQMHVDDAAQTQEPGISTDNDTSIQASTTTHKLKKNPTEMQGKSTTNTTNASKEKDKKNTGGPNFHGSHWGLLIVDKQTKVAQWVDSLISFQSHTGHRLKITAMNDAGIAAGRVLSGIEAVHRPGSTQFTKGGFQAKTLKYAAQLEHDNSCFADGGACGPFMFAFLEHIFARTAKMGDLRAMFPPRRKRATRFDSLAVRQESQDLSSKKLIRPASFRRNSQWSLS
jgi:hypothetical protein